MNYKYIIACLSRQQISWGVLIMMSVSSAWVGATHLLKQTFRSVSIVDNITSNYSTDDSSSDYEVGTCFYH